MDELIAVILGLILILGIFLRVKSFGNTSFVRASIIMLIIFIAFGIGYTILKPSLISDIVQSKKVLVSFVSGITLSFLRYFIDLLKYRSVEISNPLGHVFGGLCLSIFFMFAIEWSYSNPFFEGLFFITTLTGSAIIISLAGPILSSISIITLVTSLQGNNFAGISADNFLSFYDLLSIDISFLRLPCIIISSIFGLSQTVDYLKNAIPDITDHLQ